MDNFDWMMIFVIITLIGIGFMIAPNLLPIEKISIDKCCHDDVCWKCEMTTVKLSLLQDTLTQIGYVLSGIGLCGGFGKLFLSMGIIPGGR